MGPPPVLPPLRSIFFVASPGNLPVASWEGFGKVLEGGLERFWDVLEGFWGVFGGFVRPSFGVRYPKRNNMKKMQIL